MKIEGLKRGLGMVISLVVLAAAAPALGQEEEAQTELQASGDYLIGAGDMIEVVVWKNEEISGDFRVRPDGKFSIPLIGDVLAEGKTTDGISLQIEQKLKLFIETPYVSTIVKDASSNRVYVLGEVVRPGVYPIHGTLTVLQALALAGGFTEFASRNNMILVRETGQRRDKYQLSYSRILKEPDDRYNMILQRGDTLVVP